MLPPSVGGCTIGYSNPDVLCPRAACLRAERRRFGAVGRRGGNAPTTPEAPYFAALKLFLVFGPLLGFAALESILSRRDKRCAAAVRGGAGAGAKG